MTFEWTAEDPDRATPDRFLYKLVNDRGALNPEAPTLAELSRYRIVLWECKGSGYNGTTSLLKVTETQPFLAAYLKAGGKLWLGGRGE